MTFLFKQKVETINIAMSFYNKKEWKKFRSDVIECDGGRCTSCGRSEPQVTLQVHHKRYIKGRLPWEYATGDCETLCKGCHAAEHGIIMPKVGWEYVSDEDLGDLSGVCENCGTSIRYVCLISHKKWGFMEVGTLCCDNLTGTEVASNKRESINRYRSRRKRFLNSKRWNQKGNKHRIVQASFEVEIHNESQGFFLAIHKLKSKRRYKSLEHAKATAFDVIESGKLHEYLEKHRIKYRKQ